ncbi:MAG: peptide chain release factor N(5)-glutamine methyltransferase [Candidatus Moranbacteria bacterium]|jgi:release factor glutamine methyltransferase|nr:peptide chain release factor N(5)-glutamine methyltransferase [Candidatus Moranbacteria bacterium]MBP9801561.1 peptide chain release factor N(5)-glutamine methyltransferase [Candidatus Moranbacteria bacterium]
MKHSKKSILTLRPSSVSPEDFFLLLSFVSKKSKEYLIAHPEHLFSEMIHRKLAALVQRRKNHEPIAFITGQKEFYGFNFSVNSTTLIPRPETELIVESVLENISHQIIPSSYQTEKKFLTLIDIGTGSGNILLALLKTLEKKMPLLSLSCFGLDISSGAITLARKNARALQLHTPVRFLQSDLLQSLPAQTIEQSTHLYILANLPYLSEKIYEKCPPDVKNYEPFSALVSDTRGCAHIERLLQKIASFHSASPHLSWDIWLEISPEQKTFLTKKIRDILPTARFEFQKDLAKKYRFIHIAI